MALALFGEPDGGTANPTMAAPGRRARAVDETEDSDRRADGHLPLLAGGPHRH